MKKIIHEFINWPYSKTIFSLNTGIFLLLLFLLLTNTFHERYPDEFDNILGGWYIIHGKVIYRDFFTHHGPFAYFLAGFLELFSGQSFVRFRIVYALFMFLYLSGSYLYLKSKFGFEKVKVYLYFLIVYALSDTYFWGQMILADSVSALFLAPIFAIIFFSSFYGVQLIRRDLVVISILASFALLSSLTFMYLIAGIYFYIIFAYFYEKRKISKDDVVTVLYMAMPYVVFVFYLVISQSLLDYYHQAIQYNIKYYIYNYPRPLGSNFINPVRFAIVIAHDFFNNFHVLLTTFRDFNLGTPLNFSLALMNCSMIILLFIKKKYRLACFLLFVLIYSNARSNPMSSKETDYQSAVYLVTSFFVASFLVFENSKFIEKTKEIKRVIAYLLVSICLFYGFFSTLYLARKYIDKTYPKYMGTAPTIYDRPEIAPLIHAATDPSEYAWIGPFEFEELFYTNRPIPSRYQIFLPGIGMSDEMSRDFLGDFTRHKPTFMIFDKKFGINASDPTKYGVPFINYVEKEYTTLKQEGYVYNPGLTTRKSLEKKTYILKSEKDRILNNLLQSGKIKPIDI